MRRARSHKRAPSGQPLTPAEILRFIEDYREIHLARGKTRSKLISLKLSEPLLRAFKDKSQLSGVAYQSQIKALMRQWLSRA